MTTLAIESNPLMPKMPPSPFDPMKSLYFILSYVGTFALAAFLISFALVLAGALAELIYKFGLPNNNSF